LNTQKGFLVNFSQFLDAAHISTLTKWLEIDQDNLHMKFPALNSARLPWFKEAVAGGHERRQPSQKVVVLPLLAGVA